MKQSNVKIAVTGGIGSGKSTVCKIIAQSGCSVFSCDKIYSEILDGGNLNQELECAFGGSVICDGRVDRKALSAIVFSDDEKLRLLNSITHPKIFEEMFRRADYVGGLCFFEVPLLFEGGYQNKFDKVIVVTRKVEDRIKSVALRDGLKEDEVLNRIKQQYNYDISEFAMYYVIHNDGNIDDLKAKTLNLLSKLSNDLR